MAGPMDAVLAQVMGHGKQGGPPLNPVPEDTISGSITENAYDPAEVEALVAAMSAADPKAVQAALEAFAAGNSQGGIGAGPADLMAILQQGAAPLPGKAGGKGVPADILQQLLGDEMTQ